MDTLHDRLAELAEGAPTGGAPAAELWARGSRAHRLRAAAVAATLLVAGVVGTGIGVHLADGDADRSRPEPAGPVGIELPIAYPVGKELPELGDNPGPLAAIWVAPPVDGGPPEAVGVVAETGAFGTLPIDAPYSDEWPDVGIALSPDGVRLAYTSPTRELIVRDLVTGEASSLAFDFGFREGYAWFDATHLVGNVAAGSDVDGWVWEPGTRPERVDLSSGSRWSNPRRPWIYTQLDDPRTCSVPVRQGAEVLLCDDLGSIGSETVLTHWSSAVVALDRSDVPFDDAAQRRVVVAAGSPQRVAFATDLVGAALDAAGSTS